MDELLADLTIIKMILTDNVESKHFDKNRKFGLETLEEIRCKVKKLNIDDVSNCLHENQVMRQGDGDVYHQCLDCCELLE